MSGDSASGGTVSHLISELKRGDADAAGEIWHRFYKRLVAVAQKQLAGCPRRVADEEDVAVSVMDALCRGAKEGRFPNVCDRNDLWGLLLRITCQKVIDHQRQETRLKRGGGRVRGESVFRDGDGRDRASGLDDLPGEDPTPEFLAALTEQREHLLHKLDDVLLQSIAVAAMEGHSNEEIAEMLGVSSRTIQRKLRLICRKWSQSLLDP